MKNAVCIVLLAATITSCGVRKRTLPTTPPPSAPKAQAPIAIIQDNKLVQNYTATSYIDRFKGIAISEMNQYGIPASITLAQGLLESGNGNGSLAREANNHFGIKCNTDWRGKTILKDDDQKDDCFRVYNSPEESFRDHSEFLKRKRYAALFELDKNDYEGWARGLKEAGYATNPKYADLLITIINRYDLSQYDKSEGRIEKIKREDKVLTEIAKEIPQEKKAEVAKPSVEMKIYEVKQGDTLYSIAKKYNLTVDELKILNSLSSTDLNLGQLLLVSK